MYRYGQYSIASKPGSYHYHHRLPRRGKSSTSRKPINTYITTLYTSSVPILEIVPEESAWKNKHLSVYVWPKGPSSPNLVLSWELNACARYGNVTPVCARYEISVELDPRDPRSNRVHDILLRFWDLFLSYPAWIKVILLVLQNDKTKIEIRTGLLACRTRMLLKWPHHCRHASAYSTYGDQTIRRPASSENRAYHENIGIPTIWG